MIKDKIYASKSGTAAAESSWNNEWLKYAANNVDLLETLTNLAN